MSVASTCAPTERISASIVQSNILPAAMFKEHAVSDTGWKLNLRSSGENVRGACDLRTRSGLAFSEDDLVPVAELHGARTITVMDYLAHGFIPEALRQTDKAMAIACL